MSDPEFISEETGKIAASGALGRSRSYVRLLKFLAQCSGEGRRPKELEIATEVFRRASDFDPNQDALVRVYIHNLRQKLQRYHEESPPVSGRRLSIPRGEYRLAISPVEETADDTVRRGSGRLWAAAVAALVLINLLTLVILRPDSSSPGEPREVAGSPLWSSLLGDDVPLLVVVGDYFIFAELDEFGTVRRLVREFDVNSGDDLGNLFVSDPDLLANYMDLDLTYLPQGSASALSELLRVVYAGDKDVRITTMTEMRVADIRSQHILYVGYISALGTLMDFVFASSGLRVGASFDELQNMRTGESFTSGAGIPGESGYEDYGLVSTFPGPDGNQFLIVAGTRDSGLMHAAQAITSLEDIAELEDVLDSAPDSDAAPAFEALYEVTGFDRINLDATLVYRAPLDYRPIWGLEVGELQD